MKLCNPSRCEAYGDPSIRGRKCHNNGPLCWRGELDLLISTIKGLFTLRGAGAVSPPPAPSPSFPGEYSCDAGRVPGPEACAGCGKSSCSRRLH